MAETVVLAEHYECGIEIHAAASGGFLASVNLPDGSTFANGEPAQFDPIAFLALAIDPQGYGNLLLKTFLDGRPREGLAVARRLAAQAGQRLRLRLNIAPDATALHSLNWEWLYDADTDMPFAASPDISMSRFLEVDWPLGEPVDTTPLKVLVVVANPGNLSEYNLPALDVAVERQKIEEALAKVQGQIESAFLDGPATPRNIDDRLRNDGFHVLHVVGHGFFKHKGFLVLEDDQRQAVMADETSFGDLFLGQQATRLVVLAACVSAARSQSNAFIGLAPSLVKRGMPAVVAMQRQVPITAAQTFTEHFYRHLSRHGVIDAAVNMARYQLYLDPAHKAAGDWGTPVVFTRVAKGQLFYPTATARGSGAPLQPALARQAEPQANVEQPAPGQALAQPPRTDRPFLIELRQTLVARFSDAELKDLCFDLGVDYESLPGEGKAAKARELIAYLQRRDRLAELVPAVKQMRPDIPW